MRRAAIVPLVLALSTLTAGAREPANLYPDSPLIYRPAVELGRQQISIEARFVSIEQTDIDEFMFEAMAGAELNPTFETFSIDGAGTMTSTGSVVHQGRRRLGQQGPHNLGQGDTCDHARRNQK